MTPTAIQLILNFSSELGPDLGLLAVMLNRNRVWERHPWECTDQPHYLSADHSDFQCLFCPSHQYLDFYCKFIPFYLRYWKSVR